jgi:PAS domain S-box-containing protein
MSGVVQDITERKQAEEELKNITERLQFATEGANIGTWHWNTITGELIWSSVMNQLFDVPQEDVINYERFSQALHPDDRARTDEAVRIALDNHTDFSTEYRCIRRDGSVRWLSALGRGYYDESGKNIRMEGVVIDINDKKQAEKALIESEQRLSEAQRMASIGYWVQDVPSGKLIWSDETFRIFEVDKDFSGELYDVFRNLIHPEDREVVDIAYQNSLETKQPYEISHKLQMPDGRLKYVHERYETEYDESGNPVKSIGTVQDITKQKMTENEISKTKLKLEAALSSMSDALFIADNQGNLIHMNHSFALFHKFANLEECSRTFEEYPKILDVLTLDGEVEPIEHWAIPRALAGEVATNVEFKLRRRDTKETWIGSYNFAPIYENKGIIAGAVVTARDITASKKADEELKKHKENLEELVVERTKELEDKNTLLERINKAFVGRELKMKELKSRIRDLEND